MALVAALRLLLASSRNSFSTARHRFSPPGWDLRSADKSAPDDRRGYRKPLAPHGSPPKATNSARRGQSLAGSGYRSRLRLWGNFLAASSRNCRCPRSASASNRARRRAANSSYSASAHASAVVLLRRPLPPSGGTAFPAAMAPGSPRPGWRRGCSARFPVRPCGGLPGELSGISG